MAEPPATGESGRRAWTVQEDVVRGYEVERRMRSTAVSTNDETVRISLRELGEPITLFGEREMERRERLQRLLATRKLHGMPLPTIHRGRTGGGRDGSPAKGNQEGNVQEVFYTEGTERLEACRKRLAEGSLRRARERLHRDRERRQVRDPTTDGSAERSRSMSLDKSQVIHSRPATGCALSCGEERVATCSWDGRCRTWDANELACVSDFLAHEERCTDVRFHPGYRAGSGGPCTATGSCDRTAKLWDERGSCLATFRGHADRLGRIGFHPFGLHLGTTSFDKTWRLWDLETGQELLLQEGHSRGVYAIAFQCDGSLAVSVGLDAVGWVWDLRTGRSVTQLRGHVKQILSVDVSPDGHTVATASDDHTCKIWDLRKRACTYTMAAHSSLISTVCFEPSRGGVLMTTSYDSTVRLWSVVDQSCLNTLTAHEGNVTSGCLSSGMEFVLTAGFDKTLKRWCPEAMVEDGHVS